MKRILYKNKVSISKLPGRNSGPKGRDFMSRPELLKGSITFKQLTCYVN